MSFLSRGYAALVGDATTPQSGAEIVDKLCDRVVNSTLLEDRRAAILGLKGLSRQYQLEVGTSGLPVLLHVLHQGQADPEMTKSIIETIINLCNLDTTPTESPEENLGFQFTEIFVKDPSNVALLLSILAETDFHVRFNCIDLLKILLQNKRKSLQDCILTSPLGVSRLMDLLDDRREVIRNDGLLLLINLTHQNTDIQKIIAFENAFERLFQITYDEGGCNGDMIVQDCLQLVSNLLDDNVSNQNYFRESGLLKSISPFFGVRVNFYPQAKQQTLFSSTKDTLSEGEDPILLPWEPQKIKNALMMIDVIKILVTADNPNTPANQKAIFQSGVFTTLLQLGLLNDLPQIVRAQSLLTAAWIMRENQAIQDYFSFVAVSSGRNLSSVVVELLEISLHAKHGETLKLRSSACLILQSFLQKNFEAQKFVLATAVSPPELNPNDNEGIASKSAGSVLLGAFNDSDYRDYFKIWSASAILGLILRENTKCKESALSIEVPDHEEDYTYGLLEYFVHRLLSACRTQKDVRVLIAYFTLLSNWLNGYPKAVKSYLSEGSNFTFLIEQISQVSAHFVAQGLAAFLLGICFDANDDSVSGLTREQIQSILINRVGADQYVNRLNRLKESKELNVSLLEDAVNSMDENKDAEVFFDDKFAYFFKGLVDKLTRSVVNPKALKDIQKAKEESQMQENVIASYKQVIASQDKEIAELKKALSQAYPGDVTKAPAQDKDTATSPIQQQSSDNQVNVQSYIEEITSLQQEVIKLKGELEQAKSVAAKAQKDRDDTLVFLAEQDVEMESLKDKLRELGHPVDEDDEDEDDEDEIEEDLQQQVI